MPERKILVVDDDRNLVTAISILLQSKGYKTIAAHDGEECLVQSRVEKPDLILLDVMLPKKNGWEACKELKSEDDTKDIPIIMLTGKNLSIDVLRSWEAGANEYISKPFENEYLLGTIKKLLGEV